ncbi:MAG: hypothetical protein ABDH37_04620 [Candidatus Hydrothermales bacterium]
MKNRVKIIFVIVGTIFLLGCEGRVKIGDIYKEPRKYVDKTVVIKGKVIKSSTFPLRSFDIEDGTGKITVVTKKPLPREGETIKIKGKVKYHEGLFTREITIEEE